VVHSFKDGILTLNITPANQGRWIYILGKE